MAQRKVNWLKAFIVVGGLDVFQAALDVLLVPLGEGINLILDIIIAIGIAVWAWWKGVLDWVGAFVLLITFVIEILTAGGAPFWVLDIWALQARSGGKLLPGFDNEENVLKSAGLNQGGVRRPSNRPPPLNQGGSRRPM